jgi:hypothetical protein
MAAKITMTYLKTNNFHFQDARLRMREFLNTPFPCGYKPRQYVRGIIIFIRCERPLKDHWRYMWGKEDFDNELSSGEELPWLEDRAIVTQFATSRRNRAKYYDRLDIPRIELHFLELV